MAGEQKERMLRGDLYQAGDPELTADRRRARDLVRRFNANGSDDALLAATLSELLGHIGEESVILPPFRCDYGYNIRIGAGTFVNYGAVFLDCTTLAVGDEVQIASGVQLLTATHPLDAAARRNGWESAEPVTVEDGAWLGAGVIVCPGVTVGENTVVGAGSIVTRDLPSGVLAVGNPCRPIRQL